MMCINCFNGTFARQAKIAKGLTAFVVTLVILFAGYYIFLDDTPPPQPRMKVVSVNYTSAGEIYVLRDTQTGKEYAKIGNTISPLSP